MRDSTISIAPRLIPLIVIGFGISLNAGGIRRLWISRGVWPRPLRGRSLAGLSGSNGTCEASRWPTRSTTHRTPFRIPSGRVSVPGGRHRRAPAVVRRVE